MFLCPHSTLGLFAVEWQELLPTFARIFNLLLFVGLLYFLLRRMIGEGFRARQEGIRNDLMRAEEEHTSELQSQSNLVCRLLLEKKKEPCGSKQSSTSPWRRSLPSASASRTPARRSSTMT